MLPELQINDAGSFIPEQPRMPLVATKKVTQVRNIPAPKPLLPASRDLQPEIMPIERVASHKIGVDVPAAGPLVKIQPAVENIVYIMKHPVVPWIKGKVISHFKIFYVKRFLNFILLGGAGRNESCSLPGEITSKKVQQPNQSNKWETNSSDSAQ